MQDIIVTESGRRERNYWLDLWRYRELRYKKTLIGAVWAVIRPLFTMLVFSIIRPHRQIAFGRNRTSPTNGLCRHVAVEVFATGLSEAANSLINNSNLISKVYFPRLSVLTATVVVVFVDFLSGSRERTRYSVERASTRSAALPRDATTR